MISAIPGGRGVAEAAVEALAVVQRFVDRVHGARSRAASIAVAFLKRAIKTHWPLIWSGHITINDLFGRCRHISATSKIRRESGTVELSGRPVGWCF
jgi:hypothetical protein